MNLSKVVFHVRIVFDIFSIDCGVMYIRDGVCGGIRTEEDDYCLFTRKRSTVERAFDEYATWMGKELK